MAKRKRLTPANPMFFEGDTGETVPVSAPIAGVVADASATAALAEMSDTLIRARTEGRMVISVPLDRIDLGYLMRDRLPVYDADMDALVESLRARGQQMPIELAPQNGEGRYGLISGWRRCAALGQLYNETGAAHYGTVLALLRQPAQSGDAYLAMIEENEIRAGLSFYERARIVARTVQSGVYDSHTAALGALFAASSKAKRSKIRSFIGIVESLDGHLRFPQAIGERYGLKLARALADDPGLAARLQAQLADAGVTTTEAEQTLIGAALTPPKAAQSVKLGGALLSIKGVKTTSGRNRLSLSGPALTPEMQMRLVGWLKEQLGD